MDDVSTVYIYSDNILEGITFVDGVDEHSSHLSITSEDFSKPAEPKFDLTSPKDDKLTLKIRGGFRNWELPDNVSTAVDFIGRPDIVAVDEKGNQVLGGEFTDAAPIGNMNYQREGRQVGLLRADFPLLYDTAYTATDRSGSTIDPRFPPSTIVLVRLAYCLKYRLPAFVVFYENADGEKAATEKYDDYPPNRKYNQGQKYLYENVSTQLLNTVVGGYQEEMEESQYNILQQMVEYLLEKPVVRSKAETRLEKDVPALANAEVLTMRREDFINHIIEVINGREDPSSEFDITSLEPPKMIDWGGAHKKKPFNKAILDAGYEPQTFGSRQNPYVIETSKLKDAVTSRYPALSTKLNQLDESLETVVITPKFFQKTSSGNCLTKVDPYSGLMTVFSEWLSRDVDNEKARNVIGYSHSGCAEEELSNSSKLKRSIDNMTDLSIVSVGENNEAERWLFI
jgi:hypothetical protein